MHWSRRLDRCRFANAVAVAIKQSQRRGAPGCEVGWRAGGETNVIRSAVELRKRQTDDIFPNRFGAAATSANARLTNSLLRPPADSGRAFAFLVLGGNAFDLTAPVGMGDIVRVTGSFAAAFMHAGGLSLCSVP